MGMKILYGVLVFSRVSDPDPYWIRIQSDHWIRIRIRNLNQGCGSGYGSVLDPYSIGSVDPDPYSESGSGSGSRRAKMTHKSRKNSCFEVLDGLFCELEASSVTCTYFMEA